MVSITDWMYLIIPGFVYLSAFFFTLLLSTRTNKIKINKSVREYLPYIAIIVLFSSYILGLSFNLAFERLYFWICQNKSPVPTVQNHTISDRNIEQIDQVYAGLVMFRHLIISTIWLGISFFFWLRKNTLSRLKWHVLIFCFLLNVVFVLAYLFAQEFLNKLNGAR